MRRRYAAAAAGAAAVLAAVAVGTVTAGAATTAAAAVKVTPTTLATSGWAIDPDPNTTTAPSINAEQAPAGEFGALKFATPNTKGGKVNLYHAAPAGLTLKDLTVASYDYFKPDTSPGTAAVSFQLVIDTTPADSPQASGYTTLVYEPASNGGPKQNAWTSVDVRAGKVWSTRVASTSKTTKVPNDPKFYSKFVDDYGSATVLAYGLSQGSATGDTGPTVTSYGDHPALGTASTSTVTNFETDPTVLPASGSTKADLSVCGKAIVTVTNAAAAKPNTVREDLHVTLLTEGQVARRLTIPAGTSKSETYTFPEDFSGGHAAVVVRYADSKDVVKVKTNCDHGKPAPTGSASPTGSPTASASPTGSASPTASTSPTSSAPPSPAPTSSSAVLVPVSNDTGNGGSGGLAYTGASIAWPVGLGGAAVLAGAATLLLARRRRTTA